MGENDMNKVKEESFVSNDLNGLCLCNHLVIKLTLLKRFQT